MAIYWFMFIFTFIAASFEQSKLRYGYANFLDEPKSFILPLFFSFLVLIIGFRFEVGGDWYSYLYYLERAKELSLLNLLIIGDPAYQFLNFFSFQLGLDIYGVNILSASIFAYGLMRFCQIQPRIWLALVAAIPYLVNVIAMGYTRQSIALGLFMLALVNLIHVSLARYVFWVLLAALFHKSAIILLPIGLFVSKNKSWMSIVSMVIVTFIGYFLLLRYEVSNLYINYIEAKYQSNGAIIRILMSFLPALLFLIYKNNFTLNPKEKNLCNIFSYLSIIAFIGLFLTSATTAIDRVALYLLPLQLIIFSHLPEVIGDKKNANIHWVYLIGLYYLCVQFVWLFFADHAFAWLPYHFYPFINL